MEKAISKLMMGNCILEGGVITKCMEEEERGLTMENVSQYTIKMDIGLMPWPVKELTSSSL